MIAYLDASALVKRYIVERGSGETIALTADSEMTATSIASRAEVAAALAKAVRTSLVTHDVARNAQRRFAGDWPDLVRVPATEALVERAEGLAWEHGLRGYGAVQLASALTWQESVGEEIVVATFDQQLWEAAKRTGLKVWPEVSSSNASVTKMLASIGEFESQTDHPHDGGPPRNERRSRAIESTLTTCF